MGSRRLHNPRSIAIDHCGHYFLADKKGIHVFEPSGRFVRHVLLLKKWKPLALFFDFRGDLIAITKYLVHIHDPSTGQTKLTIGEYNTKSYGSFRGGVLSRRGEIAVIGAKTNVNKVQLFRTDGTWLKRFGSNDQSRVDYIEPRDIAVLREGGFIVVGGPRAPKIFDQHGHYRGCFALQYPSCVIWPFDDDGVTVDRKERIILTSRNRNQIIVLSNQGKLLALLGEDLLGHSHQQANIKKPTNPVIDRAGNIVIVSNASKVTVVGQPKKKVSRKKQEKSKQATKQRLDHQLQYLAAREADKALMVK